MPRVSVVTPVYNGAKYLGECIESVLAQTFDDWEYVIVDNCSTDDSLAITERYARDDARIRIHRNEKFLPVIDNLNHSLRQIDPSADYCKFVFADDRLFPECLRRMVELADENPSVGIVSSYRLVNRELRGSGLPYPTTVVSGRDVCRATLMGEFYLFGSPTSLLIRGQAARERSPYFDDPSIHADTAACYEVLRKWDFGFVQEVLTFTRRHPDSVTDSLANRFNTYMPAHLLYALKFGPVYLSEEEYRRVLEKTTNDYYMFLGGSVFMLRGRAFWAYHKSELERLGRPLSYARLVLGCLSAVRFALMNLQLALELARRK
jgi:glycosyltransferase involved in cell wall biosynthesis